MGLFDFLKSKKQSIIYAPFDCEVINIEETDDEVFNKKSLGDGLCLLPSEGVKFIYSPIEGEIVKVFKTKHAVSMKTNEGLELFVHFGLETVVLKGEGFEIVKDKGTIKVGEEIMQVNLDVIKNKAKSLQTPIVFSNMEIVSKIEKQLGKKQKGEVIATVMLK